ncbi:MAG: Gfo/Idh/MocA family oxidoreductase [Clostridium sp.]|nr:Gfo/Idh/MocA family oxidoreductase [Clostridium sp.]
MAVMGAGNIARTMARTMAAMPDVECYAVASRDPKRAKAFAEQFGFEKAYGSYEELVCDAEVELIYIATPHSHHYACAKLCLLHDKPILCEKAFMVNAAQAREILRISEERNVLAAEAIWTRYMPMAETIRGILADGMIGEPSVLTCNLGYQIADKERLVNPALAGGALLDVGVYTLNFASMLFGDEIEKITSSCIKTDTGVDASNEITLHYRDGRMAVLNSTMRGISDRKGIVYGSNGFLIVENCNNFESVSVYDADRSRILYRERPEQITGFEYEVHACISALERGMCQVDDMCHDEIVRMMEWMDECRRQWEISYPCESV